MKERTKELLLMQGYDQKSIDNNQHMDFLVRWTPLTCALLGCVGLILQSPLYFIILGALTLIGAFTRVSFYDHVYNLLFRSLLKTEKIPPHSNQRRFGCAIGAVLYIIGGIGFLLNKPYLAFIPTVLMICLAFIAAITQWCFACKLYNMIFKTKL